jgi:hypothetical protein
MQITFREGNTETALKKMGGCRYRKSCPNIYSRTSKQDVRTFYSSLSLKAERF